MTASRVRVDLADRVGVLTLDDPDRRNALDLALVAEIEAAIDDLEAGDCGAIVVTGAPPAFCAGADLSHLGSTADEGLRQIYRGFVRLAESPLPTIAAVNGAAVGAGVNMALCCDVIVAGASARIDTRFLQLGLHPGGGHTWMMRRLVGPQTTKALVLLGDVIDGAEAERLGVAYRCVPDDDLLATARGLAAKAAAANPELVRRIKATIDDVADIDAHPDALERELVDQLWSITQPEFAERLAALQAKISGR
ncbi:MAG: enoyl-CoA hydratase [Acidimicrobiales bacterium]